MSTQEIVFPGDEIAIAEEFLPGPGTYEEDGTVYAARIGTVELDTSEFQASVHARTNVPVLLEPGDLVIGDVRSIRDTFVIVEVDAAVKNPNRVVSGETNATLHISKVANAYVEDLNETFRLGDIVRAVVLEVEPALQIGTKDDRLGVLKRFCPRCRTPMERKGAGVVCPACEWKDRPKLANDFGAGSLEPEA